MSKLIRVEVSATRNKNSIATNEIPMVSDDAARICKNDRTIRYR